MKREASARNWRARVTGWLLALASAMTLASSGGDVADGARGANSGAARIQRLVDACAREMLNSVCRVSKDGSSTFASPAAAVFVAGVGPIDAAAYQSLGEAGDAMCDEVRRSCDSDWAGPGCRTARSLWAPQT